MTNLSTIRTSFVKSIDIHGNNTATSTVVDAANKLVTVTTDSPESDTFDLLDVNQNVVPDACEQNFTYDADGNLLTDENFAYTWDGENRLVVVEPVNVSLGVMRVDSAPDSEGGLNGTVLARYDYDPYGMNQPPR